MTYWQTINALQRMLDAGSGDQDAIRQALEDLTLLRNIVKRARLVCDIEGDLSYEFASIDCSGHKRPGDVGIASDIKKYIKENK